MSKSSSNMAVSASRSMPALAIRELSKHFGEGERRLDILSDVELKLLRGDMMALVGPSGCGKTSFLQMVGLLDAPDSGYVFIDGEEASKSSDRKRALMRRKNIGFVFQFHHLLPEFNALENVMMPAMADGVAKRDARAKASELLYELGLSERLKHRPAELSGGEQQRVAIARALVNDPLLLLADEPTGNLDPRTSDHVFEILLEHTKARNVATIIATHNMDLAQQIGQVMTIRDCKLVSKSVETV